MSYDPYDGLTPEEFFWTHLAPCYMAGEEAWAPIIPVHDFGLDGV